MKKTKKEVVEELKWLKREKDEWTSERSTLLLTIELFKKNTVPVGDVCGSMAKAVSAISEVLCSSSMIKGIIDGGK